MHQKTKRHGINNKTKVMKSIDLYKSFEGIINEYVKALSDTKERPEGWLPHVVYVEEDGDNYPVYKRYHITEINKDGSTKMIDTTGGKHTDIHLSEINIDWLDTLLRRYDELCAEQGLQN